MALAFISSSITHIFEPGTMVYWTIYQARMSIHRKSETPENTEHASKPKNEEVGKRAVCECQQKQPRFPMRHGSKHPTFQRHRHSSPLLPCLIIAPPTRFRLVMMEGRARRCQEVP